MVLTFLLAWALAGWLGIVAAHFVHGYRRLGKTIRTLPRRDRVRLYGMLLSPPADLAGLLSLLVLGPLAAIAFWRGLNHKEKP